MLAAHDPGSGSSLPHAAQVLRHRTPALRPRHRTLQELIEPLPLLAIDPAVMDIVDTYIARHVMPADPAGDALHLALASIHRCDFLVAWNCRHLANANKFGHIRRVNTLLGLYVPVLVTPLELLSEIDDED